MSTGWRSQEFEQSDAACVAKRAGPKVQPVDDLALANCTDDRIDGYTRGYSIRGHSVRENRTQAGRKTRTDVL